MKHMKNREVPAKTEVFVDSISCDLCGKTLPKYHMGDIDEVEISHKTGYSYPEGGAGEVESVDMCGECFENKLKPWLVSQSVIIQVKEWDF